MQSAERSGFQFTNPLLMEMQFSINREYAGSPDEEAVDIPIEMEVTKGDAANGQSNVALVMLKVTVGATGASSPYYICATMGANFRWDESISDDFVEALLSRNAPALLLGYLRPYIAQITEASPIGAVHIPFINFVPNDNLSGRKK